MRSAKVFISIIFLLKFSILLGHNNIPDKPIRPKGDTAVCVNTLDTNYYVFNDTAANSYIWILLPQEAGVISGTDTISIVSWDKNFTGTAKIAVNGHNELGDGLPSDTLFISVFSAVPLKPAKPSGDEVLIVNPLNSIYYTAKINQASSYNWLIQPVSAGSISGNDTSAIVDWNNSFVGQSKISVIAENECGAGPSSDTLYVTINDIVTEKPGKPGEPKGFTQLCINPSNTFYSTSGATEAISYNWSITPSSAGNIIGTSTMAVVDWSNSFSGMAKISVYGHNSLGDGLSSDSLMVIISSGVAARPDKPVGDTSLYPNPSNSIYKTNHNLSVLSYYWSITPVTAGTISGNDTLSYLDWNDLFTGSAKISVSAQNACGFSQSSDSLAVHILDTLPFIPARPVGDTLLCQGSNHIVYKTSGAIGALSYSWNITPSAAGEISGTGKTGTLTLNKTFKDKVKITVAGINIKGTGKASDTLNAVIYNSAPGKPTTPAGINEICLTDLGKKYIYWSEGIEGADYYEWKIKPSEAGKISGTKTMGTLTWNKDFIGTADIYLRGFNDCGAGDSSNVLQVLVKDCTPQGIGNESTSNNLFQIYPNPSNGLITIKIQNEQTGYCTIEIINSIGKIVFRTTTSDAEIKINLNHRDIYFVKISNNQFIKTEKIIIR